MPDDMPQQVAPPPGYVLEQTSAVATPPPGYSLEKAEADYAPEVRDYWSRRRREEPNLTLEAAERQYRSTIGKGAPAVPATQVLSRTAAGVGKGVAETIQGATKLANFAARKLDPFESPEHPTPQIPVPFATEDLEAEGTAESVGKFGEMVGEFAIGSAAVKGLMGMAKIPATVLELAEKYPTAARLLVKVAQSGEVAPRVLPRVAESAVKGAVGGGIQAAVKEGESGAAIPGAVGGAVGAAAGEAVGAVARPILRAIGLAKTEEEAARQAVRPGKRNYRFIQDWSLAKPRLQREIAEKGVFGSMQEAADRIAEVRNGVWVEEVVPAVTRHSDEVFDTRPVVSEIRSRITPQMKTHAPEQVKIIGDIANRFVSARKVGDVEQELEFLNAQLTEAGWWRKLPQERAAAVKANGQLSGTDAAVTAMRDALYDHLEQAGESGVRESKRLYGALRNVENEVRGQVNVAGRQVPLSLKNVIGLTAGIAHGGLGGLAAAAIPFLDKLYNAPEALLTRTVKKGAPLGPARAAAQKITASAGEVAKVAAPVAGEKMSVVGKSAMRPALEGPAPGLPSVPPGHLRIRASDGSIHDIPEESMDRARERDPGLQVLPQ